MIDDPLLSPREAKFLLMNQGVNAAMPTVYKYFRTNEFPVVRIGGRIFVRKSRLLEWINSNN